MVPQLKILNGFVACALLAVVGLGSTLPAHAEEKTMTSTVLGVFGLSSDKDEDGIQYRERAPLVIPPKLELPAPAKPVTARSAAWPQDQEIARKKKKAEEARAQRKEDPTLMTAQELRDIRLDKPVERAPDPCAHVEFGAICNQEAFWNSLKLTKKEEKVLPPGQEPEREYLTQPPKGFMAANKQVKPTFEAPRQEVDLGDPRAQMREEARRKSED